MRSRAQRALKSFGLGLQQRIPQLSRGDEKYYLGHRLQKDELNAVQALEAYVWKAMEVQERLNCCIEVIKEVGLDIMDINYWSAFISQAFDTAAEADKNWSFSKEKPPLYGIPFSVKGNFYMPGYDCCIGLAKFLGQPRSPGGSSGGEGALLMGGGTPFGTGSDLAGSLRIPAAFSGAVTLKPTEGRLVVVNTHPGVPGRCRLGLSFGFFTHTVEQQVMLLKTIIGNPDYRAIVPTSIPAPLNDTLLSQRTRLKIGYYDDDGFCPPVPW
ncbi:hypothetical protein NECAME_07620 [Necator americanus]|uniref:Amidase domain-containing protein n=1 Tax=Necator americanus TaxID=51031 RepID=W2TPA3_NECAM|nr:hypothetical protein NECAME_07620 [Necator americanus]ETN82966.1 hypothetical protein NECAME_07620 [Necator americanus]